MGIIAFAPLITNMTPRTTSPDSWQDDMDFSQRPPTSSTSDFSDHSFHSRSKSSANVNSPKRLSMFSSRSRSNTANVSYAPTRELPAESLSYGEHPVSPVPYEEKTSENVARSLLVRGSRILRRQGSKLNVVATTLEEEDEFGKSAARFEVSKVFQRVPKLKKNESNDQLKRIISEPYNFHHVTHTSSTQFQALDNTSNVELVEEFSVIQASQTPEPGLKGIRAQALRSDDSLENADDLERRQPTSPTSPLRRSPPVSPREPRSPGRVENFSRPVSRLNKSLPPSPSIIAPPRVSSRQAQSDIPEPTSLAIDELLGVNIQPTIRDYEYPSLDSASFRMVPSLDRIDLAGIFQPELSHAMMGSQLQTTNDPSIEDDGKTTTPFINSYLFDLEDVPEEDETKETDEPIVRTSRFMSISGSIGEFVANEAKVTAAPAHESIIVVQDPQLSFTEEVTSPVLPNFQPIIQDSPVSQASNKTRRTSVAGLVQFPMTWEEDIDFCYEHEAVADCEFDWSRLSLDASRNSVPGAAMVPSLASAAKNMVPHYLQLNASSISATPDLDTGSAQSILTRSHEALTPLSDGAAHGGFFNAGPADHEYPKKLETGDVDNETAYESFLAVGDDSERQFQYYTQTSHPVDVTASPRSSYSQISKYNSQESVILSRAASIVRKHRSSTSTTSVPELTNSANSSRENTIRGSIGSLEHTPLGAMSEASRPGFSIHRPIKSLGSELSALAKLRSAGSNSSIHVVDLPYPSPSPTHDRTKSTSTLDHDDEHQAMQSVQGLPFAVRQSLAAQKRKSRAGYSLFPTLQ